MQPAEEEILSQPLLKILPLDYYYGKNTHSKKQMS